MKARINLATVKFFSGVWFQKTIWKNCCYLNLTENLKNLIFYHCWVRKKFHMVHRRLCQKSFAARLLEISMYKARARYIVRIANIESLANRWVISRVTLIYNNMNGIGKEEASFSIWMPILSMNAIPLLLRHNNRRV